MRRVIVLALLMLLAPVAGQAACSLAQPPNMSLGVYSGTQSDSGSINLVVTCPAGSANYTLAMNGGSSGSTTARTMASGAVKLNYGLFHDSARTQNWGNVAGTDAYFGNGSVASISIPLYPRIAGGQVVAPGTYVDTMTTGLKTFTVTATVPASCQLSATTLAFGTYTGAQNDASSTLSVTCTSTTPYNLGLSAGNGNGATVTTRQMQGRDSHGLKYALFQDAARTLNWGTTVGTDTVADTGNGIAQSIPVYGRVAPGQLVAPGAYSDTIVATVNY